MHSHPDPRSPLGSFDADVTVDQQILHALESKPNPAIPADFAARIAAKASTISTPTRALSTRAPRYGLIAAWSSLIVLSVAIFFLSPASLTLHAPAPLLIIECVLILQLLALSLWLASPRFPGRT